MPTLGIIGGIAPPSTIEYYRAVIDIHRERTGGRAPRVLINSLDGDEVLRHLSSAQTVELAALLRQGIRDLAAGGAHLAVLASASVHIAFERLQEESPLPLIGIVDATVEASRAHSRLGLFGTNFTVRADLFGPKLAACGISVVRPTPREQDDIHRIYLEELVAGHFRSSSRSRLVEIAYRMREEELIDGVLLAGTELPLILPDKHYDGLPFINTSRAHVEAAVTAMLASS